MAINREGKLYIAGHTGLVGSAILRKCEEKGFRNIITRTHGELDLTSQQQTEAFFQQEKPDYVIVAAGLVGGIKANSKSPADFFFVNMAIANNVIWAAHNVGVKKLLYLGSACMYPKECPQPMKEEYLLTGIPEITNEGYAIAKIAGCRLCSYMRKQYGDDFISVIPANAYGLNDCFDLEKSHVIPALIMKYHNAKVNNLPYVEMWGTGKPLREFIFTEDLADACIFLLDKYSSEETINIGTGEEVSMRDLGNIIGRIVGYEGKVNFDCSKPDGMMRRIVDNSKIIGLGWRPSIYMEQGVQLAFENYLKSIEE